MSNYIIDPINDTDYYTDVRDLLGITDDDLTNDALKSDIMLGAAERAICKIYVPNWQAVMTGSDQMAADALRSCVVIRVALNILNMPATQNLIEDKVQLIDIIITAKKQTTDELKKLLGDLFMQQLSSVGVEHSGDGYPVRTLLGKSDSVSFYDYYVDTTGNVQKEIA